ncbi:uncharacterized protein N7482_003213 [Penicillium canariense]|uniref:Uncharacterized protein n=1 Tax=Penicillium canariense TaxID=189055 RepID=A0A9W9LN69_9EURO|nr:uncharacterized protein N7482_003213 [Penicillium canariense]KAJ5167619.1 hypothetical protein N7482_003213 [Penicillium canariense]
MNEPRHSLKARPPDTSSLLDQSSDNFEFPPLQPLSHNNSFSKPSAFDEPIIRDGSPIDLGVGLNEAAGAGHAVDSRHVSSLLVQPSVSDHHVVPAIALCERGERLPKKTEPIPKKGNPRMGWLKWAIQDSSIFANQQEEIIAAQYGTHNKTFFSGVQDNSFFQWGLRYVPAASHDNVFRTVVIGNLPHACTLTQILPQIRGGPIFSASLLNTWTITGCPTALITFNHQKGALNFLRRVGRDGFYVGASAAQVQPVPTPTYLMTGDMETQINKLGRTRCLVVSSRRSGNLKKGIHRVLATSRLRNYVECFGERDPDGEVTIRFHSVKMAGVACTMLVNDERLRGAFVKTAPDPCSLV